MAIEMPSFLLGNSRRCSAKRSVAARVGVLTVRGFCYAGRRRANSIREIAAVANRPIPATTNAGP